jgi:phosphoglycerate dehydrogenase-like enzyme
MNVKVIKPFIEILRKTYPNINFYEMNEECDSAEILIGEPDDIIPEKLEKLPDLKWIQSLRAGFDNIDTEYFKKRGIMFTNGKDIYSVPIAEDVVCKILMHNTNALKYLNHQKEHVWKPGLKRRELKGKVVGIIGTGSIATEIAMRLQGFGVEVIGYKRTPVSTQAYFHEVFTGKSGLDHIMSNSDYIVLTVDLNKETHHMINKDNLKLMKSDASIINIARGSVINEEDLTQALKNNEISYAGLDVFETEPLPENSELWDLDNVYITPHTSGIVKNNKDRLSKLIISNIQKYVDNEKLLNVVR